MAGGKTLTYVCRTAQEKRRMRRKKEERIGKTRGSKSTGEQR
jgi:hypothetical protein